MKRSLLIVFSVAVVGLAGGVVELMNRRELALEVAKFESYNTRDGKKEAEADIASGTPKWKVCGLYRNHEEDSVRLKRLGIEVDWFAGCVVSEAILRYEYSYNTTIHSHFVGLVGKEITEEVLGPPPHDPAGEEKG